MHLHRTQPSNIYKNRNKEGFNHCYEVESSLFKIIATKAFWKAKLSHQITIRLLKAQCNNIDDDNYMVDKVFQFGIIQVPKRAYNDFARIKWHRYPGIRDRLAGPLHNGEHRDRDVTLDNIISLTLSRGHAGVHSFTDQPPTTVYFVCISNKNNKDKNETTHEGVVQLQSVDVEHVGGHGLGAKYKKRKREHLFSNAFDINDLNIDDTIDIFTEYDESTDAYYCKFMIKSKDINNYALTSNRHFKKNGTSTTSLASIRNWKMKLNFDKFRYYYALASPNCKCNDDIAAGFQFEITHKTF